MRLQSPRFPNVEVGAFFVSENSGKEVAMKDFKIFFLKPYIFPFPVIYHVRGMKASRRTLTTEYPFIRYIPCIGARAPAKAAGPP